MFSSKVKRRQHNFDPFNLSKEEDNKEKKIKFERLSKSVHPKPLWWLFAAFMLVCILYWYFTKNY